MTNTTNFIQNITTDITAIASGDVTHIPTLVLAGLLIVSNVLAVLPIKPNSLIDVILVGIKAAAEYAKKNKK